MSDAESPESHLRRLLSELKASQELERLAARRRETARAEVRNRVADLHDSLVVPSLRAFAAELERQGFQTRFEKCSATQTRLHVQVHGRRVVDATVEVDWKLEPDARLRTCVRHQFRDEASIALAAEDLDGAALARTWVALLEPLVALANR